MVNTESFLFLYWNDGVLIKRLKVIYKQSTIAAFKHFIRQVMQSLRKSSAVECIVKTNPNTSE